MQKKYRFKVWLDRRGGFKSSVTRKKLRPLISPPSCASLQYSPNHKKYSIFFKKYSSKFQSDKNIPLSPLFLFNFLPNTKNIPCSPQFFSKFQSHKNIPCSPLFFSSIFFQTQKIFCVPHNISSKFHSQRLLHA